MMKMKRIAIVCLGLLLCANSLNGAEPFRDGERVCFLGDSITKQGGYHAQVLLFYVTRFPEKSVKMWNCGIAGDTAAGGFKRYDWDVAPYKPTVVSIMMGMNDVGRGYYADKNPDKTVQEKRQQAIDRNIAYMEKLVERVTGDGGRAVLITPSLYDQTGKQEIANLFGVNDALKACGEGARRIAGQSKAADLIEFNAPMAAINAEWQAEDPAFTVVGKDRVHPGAAGHLVMAYLYLKAQGVSGIVSRMELDLNKRKVVTQENCSVSDISIGADRVAFDLLERALPFPVDEKSRSALELVPFVEEFNKEIRKVTHLEKGEYEVKIDGEIVLITDSDALARGINLAVVKNTPQYRQAEVVAERVLRRHEVGKVIRNYALLKQQFFPDENDLTPAGEREILEKNLEKLKGKSGKWNTYRTAMIERYLKSEGGRVAAEEECSRLLEEIYRLNKPRSHRVVIELRAKMTL